jgi:hypothetical protein
VAPVWEVSRSAGGVIGNLAKKKAFVNHYSFHIIDPEWGHLTIKLSGHPPFGAQILLNGHEWVALKAQAAGIGFTNQGNCFTRVTDPPALAQVAAAVSHPGTIGRLRQGCERWIYSACLCFGLDADEQARSGFRYASSADQAEYSRNLLFRVGGQMDRVFNAVVDRTRGRLDVPILRTLFGAKHRPHHDRATGPPTLAVVLETPRYDLTWFKVHFGLLSLKAYTKGEHVLRVEATVHNTRELGCGRVLERFPEIISRLAGMAERFCTTLDCVDAGFVTDQTLDELPRPSQLGRTKVGGVDLNQPRMRAALAAALALAAAPRGLHRRRAHRQGPRDDRADQLHDPPGRLRPAQAPRQGPHRQTGQVPPLPGPAHSRPHDRGPARPPRPGHRPHPGRGPQPRLGRKPAHWTAIDRDYETLRIGMQALFADLGITTSSAAA